MQIIPARCGAPPTGQNFLRTGLLSETLATYVPPYSLSFAGPSEGSLCLPPPQVPPLFLPKGICFPEDPEDSG